MTKDKIMKLSDKKLRIKAAKLNGEKIVCEEWPCGSPPDSCKFEAAQLVTKQGDKWITDIPKWHPTPWPVVLQDFEWAEWPPTYNEENKDWVGNVEPIKDYPNDIEAALALWSQITEDKEIWWNPIKPNVFLSWDKSGDLDGEYAYWIEGKPEELPRLLTQAFVIYKEREG